MPTSTLHPQHCDLQTLWLAKTTLPPSRHGDLNNKRGDESEHGKTTASFICGQQNSHPDTSPQRPWQRERVDAVYRILPSLYRLYTPKPKSLFVLRAFFLIIFCNVGIGFISLYFPYPKNARVCGFALQYIGVQIQRPSAYRWTGGRHH